MCPSNKAQSTKVAFLKSAPLLVLLLSMMIMLMSLMKAERRCWWCLTACRRFWQLHHQLQAELSIGENKSICSKSLKSACRRQVKSSRDWAETRATTQQHRQCQGKCRWYIVRVKWWCRWEEKKQSTNLSTDDTGAQTHILLISENTGHRQIGC